MNISFKAIEEQFQFTVRQYQKTYLNVGAEYYEYTAARAQIIGIVLLFNVLKKVDLLADQYLAKVDNIFLRGDSESYGEIDRTPLIESNSVSSIRAVAPSYRLLIKRFKLARIHRSNFGHGFNFKAAFYLSKVKREKRNMSLSSLVDAHTFNILKYFGVTRLGQLRDRFRELIKLPDQLITWPDGGFCSNGIPDKCINDCSVLLYTYYPKQN